MVSSRTSSGTGSLSYDRPKSGDVPPFVLPSLWGYLSEGPTEAAWPARSTLPARACSTGSTGPPARSARPSARPARPLDRPARSTGPTARSARLDRLGSIGSARPRPRRPDRSIGPPACARPARVASARPSMARLDWLGSIGPPARNKIIKRLKQTK